MGRMITFASNGGTGQGYLTEADGPGIIVVQEWWGLTDQIKGVADRFAAEGFTALAPSFYQGKATREPDEAGKLMMALTSEGVTEIGRGAARHLFELTGKAVGVIGFCMGGQLALMVAASAPQQVRACVDMYGIHPKMQPDFKAMKAAVLALFAELDPSIPEQARESMRAAMASAQLTFEMDVIPGVDHAFMNETRSDVYNKEVAEKTWARALDWFRKYV